MQIVGEKNSNQQASVKIGPQGPPLNWKETSASVTYRKTYSRLSLPFRNTQIRKDKQKSIQRDVDMTCALGVYIHMCI